MIVIIKQTNLNVLNYSHIFITQQEICKNIDRMFQKSIHYCLTVIQRMLSLHVIHIHGI